MTEEKPKPVMEDVEISRILVDSSNPNKMGKENFEALKLNIEKYGFIVPVIVNQNYKLADGFHRYKAARELGMDKIPAIVLPVDDVDRRLLRQVLNKLKGRHDKKLDAEDFKWLDDNGGTSELLALLPYEQAYVKEVLSQSEPQIPFEGSEEEKPLGRSDKLYEMTVTCPKCKFKFAKANDKSEESKQ